MRFVPPPAVPLARPLLWWSVGWGLILLVVYFALTPQPPSPSFSHADKLGHVLAYFALMAWWTQLVPGPRRLALAFLLMGGALELLQHWGGIRSGECLDLAANCLGIGLGWLTSGWAPNWLARLEPGGAR